LEDDDEKKIQSLPLGVYYGWTRIDDGPIYEMAMNIGYNPFYGNKERSVVWH
jgi:riboflavin kinase